MFERLILTLISLFIVITSYHFNFIDIIYEWDLKEFLLSLPTYFLPTFFISIIGIYIGIKNYFRKVGHSVSGYYIPGSSLYFKDKQIYEMTLINNKDKPLVIRHIIIKFGWNVNLHIYDYENKGILIIKPYEQETINFDPILFYHCSDVHVTNLDFITNQRGKIILNTTEGNIKVRNFKKYFDPIVELLKYEKFVLIQPFFTKNSNEYSNLKFILNYIDADGSSRSEYILNSNKPLIIDRLHLNDIDKLDENSLKIIIEENIESKTLSWDSFDIINVEDKLKSYLSRYPRKYTCSDKTFFTFFEYYSGFIKSRLKNRYKSILHKYQSKK